MNGLFEAFLNHLQCCGYIIFAVEQTFFQVFFHHFFHECLEVIFWFPSQFGLCFGGVPDEEFYFGGAEVSRVNGNNLFSGLQLVVSIGAGSTPVRKNTFLSQKPLWSSEALCLLDHGELPRGL